MRYEELLRQELGLSVRAEWAKLPLDRYVEAVIDTTDRFFTKHPGYHAIFMQIQATTSELVEIEAAADALLIQDLATSLSQRDPSLSAIDCQAISFVLVKAIGTLLWLAPSLESDFRQRLVVEAKQLMLSYLQSHLPSTSTDR